MPKSKIDENKVFDRDVWAISLLNTGKGTNGLIGGHNKIVVEGIKVNSGPQFLGPSIEELYIGEFHIMAETTEEEFLSILPNALKNVKGVIIVLFSEKDQYRPEKEQQYKNAISTTWLVPRSDAITMVKAIKSEAEQCESGNNPPYQYAGNHCFYSYGKGHNCASWCEEKLALAGAGNGMLPTDSTKALPELHARNCEIV